MQMVVMSGILLEDINDRKITKNVIFNFWYFFFVFRGNQFNQIKLSPNGFETRDLYEIIMSTDAGK